MKQFIDLHMHSTASDGQYSPREIVNLAKASRIELMALTDHDTVDGIREARQYAGLSGIPFVPGIEISSQDTEEIHILGYGIKEDDRELLRFCAEFKEARQNRGQKICEYLSGLGIDIDYEEIKVKAENGLIARPHFAAWLMENGIVNTRKEAFSQYLDTPEFREATDRKKLSPEQSIALIHQAGGKAVLAHPGLYRMNMDEKEQLVRRLKEDGIDGIECFYSKHCPEETDRYLNWAYKYDLRISCGSDFHGERVKPDVKMGMTFDYIGYHKYLITEYL